MPMASVNHPSFYDPSMMATVKDAFYDVWEVVEKQDAMRFRIGDSELKAAIIRRLLDLVAEGKHERRELANCALMSLPL
jgi:hypothetical protein